MLTAHIPSPEACAKFIQQVHDFMTETMCEVARREIPYALSHIRFSCRHGEERREIMKYLPLAATLRTRGDIIWARLNVKVLTPRTPHEVRYIEFTLGPPSDSARQMGFNRLVFATGDPDKPVEIRPILGGRADIRIQPKGVQQILADP